MDKVRWGLLSTASINRRLIPAIRMSARGELAAVASRSQESAEAYAAEWGIPQAFGTYQAMLESDAVDAVYIGLPNHMHAEWSVTAMQNGKHVLCEKPFALSLAEVDGMMAVSQQTGMHLAEAFMYRHHPQTKIAGEWIRNGRLGDIVFVRGHFSFKLVNRNDIRLNPEYGGGSLWDIGIYPLSFSQFVMGGAPNVVWGKQWLGDSGVDESFAGQMDYGDGRTAQISCSFRLPFHAWIEIMGTKGRMTLSRPFVDLDDGRRQLLYHHPDDTIEEVPVPEKELYLGEVENLHSAILDQQPGYLTLTETRNHVCTALALYQSARSGDIGHMKVKN